MKNDWKFIQILIGANDACPLCWEVDRPSVDEAADYFESQLNATIEVFRVKSLSYIFQQLRQNFPRLFVNIIPLFNISGVYWLSLGKDYCFIFHDIIPFEA